MGYIVKVNELRPVIESNEAIENYARPSDRNDVQRFVGFVNYYRKFIPNLSELGHPITMLLSSKIDFKWTKEQEIVFIRLKEILLSDLVLAQPDYNREFILETDASKYGIGAILSQDFEDGRKPIMFISRKLRNEELNYSVSDKECLGALWAMEKLKYFLYGTEFVVITDHQALESLNKGEIKSARIERWLERLAMFNYKIVYKKGEEIPHVDALSRSFSKEEIKNIEEKQDNKVAKRINAIEDCTDKLCQINTDVTEISLEEKEKIILRKHEELVHRGNNIIHKELQKEYNWPDLGPLTKKVISTCMECKKYNVKKNSKIKFVTSYKRGEKFAVDIIGSINKVYIITGIDYFTRKGYAKAIPSRSEGNVVGFLNDVYRELPFETLIMDQAKEFLSKSVEEWANKNEVRLHFTTPFHHQSNGRVERFNRTLQEGIFKSKSNESLKEVLKKVLDVYNKV